jgi:hypothetical protein
VWQSNWLKINKLHLLARSLRSLWVGFFRSFGAPQGGRMRKLTLAMIDRRRDSPGFVSESRACGRDLQDHTVLTVRRLRVAVVAAGRSPFRSPQRWCCWQLVLRQESLLLAGVGSRNSLRRVIRA